MTVENRILQILEQSKEMRLHDLAEATGASRQMVHRAVKALLDKKQVERIGSPPKTYYRLSKVAVVQKFEISDSESLFLEEHFLLVTETGSRLVGQQALAHWCTTQRLPIEKTVGEYIKTRKKYLAYFQSNGLINGTQKIIATKGLQHIGLDEAHYLDFYAMERFGKTRLGLLMHLAKQGQNRKLMDEIVKLCEQRVHRFAKDHNFDAVGFIPPTIRREVQFMKVLERQLNLPLPRVNLVKVTGEIVIPQKSLSRIEERVNNARASIFVDEKRRFKKVLLIDDAIGSGATMNECAVKIKAQSVADKVIGISITGSFRGFEVIHEV